MTDSSHTLRELDLGRDVLVIADLIELCFSSQMDEEGRDYIRFLRRTASDRDYHRWFEGAGDRVAHRLHGFVCEAQGEVIGNLTLIPSCRRGIWRYIIANVAVHPDFRRKGIARKLTEVALTHARQRGVHAAWLQVREDNPAAIELYRSLGFIERSRRSTWHACTEPLTTTGKDDQAQINRRAHRDWRQQYQWLKNTYPSEVIWNLPLEPHYLSAGWWAALQRLLNNDTIQQWSARQDGELIGVATWQAGQRRVDHLWLAIDPAQEERALNALLRHVREFLPKQRTLLVNYPACRGKESFTTNGFQFQHTLLWMEVRFKNYSEDTD